MRVDMLDIPPFPWITLKGRTFDVGRGEGVRSALTVNKSSREGVVVFKG